MSIILPFPGGLKSYLENPSSILASRPSTCGACGCDRRWHCHGHRRRYSSSDSQSVQTLVFLVRCPGCRATTVLIPDVILPRKHSPTEIARTAIEGYLDQEASYRSVPLDLIYDELPPTESRSVIWGSSEAPTPTPSTIFRWVASFSAIASAWWPFIAFELQSRLESALCPPPLPAHLHRKSRSEQKKRQIESAWFLLWALRALLEILELPAGNWPRLLSFIPSRPAGVEKGQWFAIPSRAPP